MAETIILHIEVTRPEDPQAWEEHFFQVGCEVARRLSERYLQARDEALEEEAKPAGWRVVEKRARTLVTRFGEVRVTRRLYRDEAGRGRFLLDEQMGWRPRQVATPAVHEAVVAMAADMSFEQVVAHVARLTAGVLSKSTVWRLVQRVGREVLAAEAAQREAVYERGEVPPPGSRPARVLYVEADGVWVRWQRAKERWMEMYVGLAYEGWAPVRSGEGARYRLRHKRVYVYGGEQQTFWEGAALAWWREWDWRRVERVVVNGDDAGWIGRVTALWERVIRQQDGFHLARTCRRALGKEAGQALYEALRAGRWAEAAAAWG